MKWSTTMQEEESDTVLDFEAADLEANPSLFRDQCLIPNRPAIIRCVNLDGENGGKLRRMLSAQSLLQQFGADHKVPSMHRGVVERGAEGKEEVAEPDECVQLTLQQWAEYLHLNQHNPSSRRNAGPETQGPPQLTTTITSVYLKDWHFQRELEEQIFVRSDDRHEIDSSRSLYSVPTWLGGDWLNPFSLQQRAKMLHLRREGATEVTDDGEAGSQGGPSHLPLFGNGDDYRFAYLGLAAKTSTPFHFDVFGSYSWSFNVQGHKQWLFPTLAQQEVLAAHFPSHRLRPRGIRDAIKEAASSSSSRSSSPSPPQANTATPTVESVLQGPGDLVFVPSCYFHEVHNVADEAKGSSGPPGIRSEEEEDQPELCISVNHNWCNQHNILRMAQLLCQEVETIDTLTDEESKGALKMPYTMEGEDGQEVHLPPDWPQLVNRMLKGSGSWDIPAFLALLDYARGVAVCSDQEIPSSSSNGLTVIDQAETLVKDAVAKYL